MISPPPLSRLDPRRARAGGGAHPGFSLLELLIVMTLVILALTLAAQLLLESQRTYAVAGREARDPRVAPTLAQLRADVRSAAGVATGAGGALVLQGHPAGTVRWESRRGELVRTVEPPGGEPVSRTALRRLAGWVWRLEGGLVTVEVVYRRHESARVVTAPRLGPAQLETERVTLVLAPRGPTRRDRW